MTVKVRITGWDIKVLNGSRFVSYPQPESTGSIIHRVDSHSNGSGHYIYRKIQIIEKAEKLVRKNAKLSLKNFEQIKKR